MRNLNLMLLILFLISCNNEQRKVIDGVECLSLSADNILSAVNLSEIAQEATFVLLETNDDLLLNEITKIVSHETDLYITDGTGVYIFDANGKLKSSLQRQGEGPEEYIRISDFQITDDGEIWILCRNSKTLYLYDSDMLVRKISLDYWVSNIFLKNDSTMLLYIGNEIAGDNAHQLKMMNLENESITRKHLPIDNEKSNYLHVMSSNHFVSPSVDNNQFVYFFQIFNDTVYAITNNEIIPCYYVDIDKKNIPRSLYDQPYENIMEFFQRLHQNSYAYGTNWFSENDNSYFYSYYYEGEAHIAVVPKDRKAVSFVFKDVVADIYSHKYPINLTDLNVSLQKDGTLAFPVYPYDIIEYIRENTNEQDLADIKNRMQYVEDMNPVIFKIKW